MLEFKNVDVSVSKTPILKNLSVCFEEGKITSIIGPNGCGKTTLLQTLIGVSSITSGDIIVDGKAFRNLQARERARLLSFLPQFRESAPCISVNTLVEHGRFPYMGFSRKMSEEDRIAVDKAIEYTGLSEYRYCMVNELSGGMQQRVYLAMQLAQNSPYMVMDEPMNYLDFPGQRELYGLIRDLVAKDKTIIIVLHDIGQALRISDEIVVMNERKICGTGTPEDLLKSGLIENVFNCKINEVTVDGLKQYVFR